MQDGTDNEYFEEDTMSSLEIEIDGVVTIGKDFYVKTPDALEQLLTQLRAVGYAIEDLRSAEARERSTRSVHPVKMEKSGQPLWFCKLEDLRRGKCGSCNSHISTRGIQTQGHTCEVCGAVTYYEIIDGTIIRFEFLGASTNGLFCPQLSMRAKRWDAENELLYLYPEPLENISWGVVVGERAQEYLNQNASAWEMVTEDEQELIRLRYRRSMFLESEDVINTMEITGHYWNHTIVKLWEGKEYREFDQLPIPESFHIFETWHWAPLPTSPTLHKRLFRAIYMVSDKGYYYQDGRPEFTSYHWQEIGKFIRHFTTLNADEYDRLWPRFHKSGPGGIDDLALFCHENPDVEDRPNFGNTLVAIGKAIEGKPLTQAEIDAAVRGVSDDPNNPFRGGHF